MPLDSDEAHTGSTFFEFELEILEKKKPTAW
jgi:hypothetical protein